MIATAVPTDPTEQPPKTLAEMAAEAQAAEGLGMTCPNCGWMCLPAIKTVRMPNGETGRVRKCRRCGKKVLSRERVIGEVKKREG